MAGSRIAAGFVLFIASCALAAPAREGDPLLTGTKWKGKLTQKGTFAGGGMGPELFDIVMTITKRDGERIEADFHAKSGNIELTYLVKGEIVPAADGKGYAVTFQSYDAKNVKNTSPLLNIPYTATQSGRTLKGSWKLPKEYGDTDVAGDFDLELSK